jgi:Ran-binding protein 3
LTFLKPQTDGIKGDVPAGKKNGATAKETSPIPSRLSANTSNEDANADPKTSNLAFANSASGASSSAQSGFAALAGKPSIYETASNASSGFASLAGKPSALEGNTSTATPSVGGSVGTSQSSINHDREAAAAPASKLSFGSGSSGFSGLAAVSNSKGFGSSFGSFFSAPAGQKLSSFASMATSTTLSSEKPAKPFGAPESDVEEGSETSVNENETKADEEAVPVLDDKKKTAKLGKGKVCA